MWSDAASRSPHVATLRSASAALRYAPDGPRPSGRCARLAPRYAPTGSGRAHCVRSPRHRRSLAGARSMACWVAAPLTSLRPGPRPGSQLLRRCSMAGRCRHRPASARLGEQVPLRRVLRLRLRRRSLALVASAASGLATPALTPPCSRPAAPHGSSPSARWRVPTGRSFRSARWLGSNAATPTVGWRRPSGPGSVAGCIVLLRAWMPPMRQGFDSAP